MKKRIITLTVAIALVLAFVPAAVAADEVIHFPDPYFEAAVREQIGKPMGDIHVSDVEGILILDVGGEYDWEKKMSTGNITDLTGIEYFTALRYLFCYYNKLSTLDVSHNPALEWIVCYGNQLTALDVSKNPTLEYLNCYHNRLTSLDVRQNPVITESRLQLESTKSTGCNPKPRVILA